MQNVSATYRALREASGSYEDVRIRNIDSGTTYNIHKLKSIKISHPAFTGNGPCVGGTVSAEVTAVIQETSANWPRMSEFKVEFRMVSADGQTASEWICAGTFFTDTRKPEADSYYLSVTGYDAMLLLERSWTDKVPEEDLPTSWPITAKAAVELAVGTTDFEIDERTVLDDSVAYIGLDTTSTVREILASAAAGMGGNWVLTGPGKLRLIPLKPYSGTTAAIAGIAVAGMTIVGVSEGSDADDQIAIQGADAKRFAPGAPLPAITGVELTASNGDVAFAGSRSGYVIKGTCDFASTDIASLCLSRLTGVVYRPFTANCSWPDPAFEHGDFAVVNNVYYPIFVINRFVSRVTTADISAPYEQEIDHEFTFMSESAKALRKALGAAGDAAEFRAELTSAISQTASSIRTEVSETYFTQEDAEQLDGDLREEIQTTDESIRSDVADGYYSKASTDGLISSVRSQVTQTKNTLEVSITNVRNEANGGYNEIKQYIRYEEGVVIIGQTDQPSDFRISPTEIGAYISGQKTTYWNQNEQVTPNKLRIPSGGSLQEGDFIWQPRTSGNLSLMWVGD